MFCFLFLFLSCGADAVSRNEKTVDSKITLVEEQEIEVKKLKLEIEIANQKLDCIPQIIEKNISVGCQKIIQSQK